MNPKTETKTTKYTTIFHHASTTLLLHQAVQPSQIKSPPQQSLQTTKPNQNPTASPNHPPYSPANPHLQSITAAHHHLQLIKPFTKSSRETHACNFTNSQPKQLQASQEEEKKGMRADNKKNERDA
jgi:hypothetical protein